MPKAASAKTVSARKKLFLSGPAAIVAYVLGALVVAGLLWLLLSATNSWDSSKNNCITDPELSVKTIQAGDATLEAEAAETGEAHQKGLSDRNCLGEGKAMLFSYARSGDYCYWMKDMNFPIDMIWLDDEKKIVTIEADVSPDSYPNTTYCPTKPAQYVVEVNAGVAKANNWQVGTQFSF